MTRVELNKLIELHESRLAHLLNLLDNHYSDIEELDQQNEWVTLLVKEKKILAGLKAMTADDDE
ncbi:hypothetical protein GCM10027347_61310 [Larkinella harenae]